MPLLLSLAACTEHPDTADKASPDTDTGSISEPASWTAQRACGSIRLLATAQDRGLAIRLPADVGAAVIEQVVLELDQDFAGEAYGIVQDGMVESDVCSSVEDFPPGSGPHWRITGGTAHATFTPTPGLGAEDTDWSYDGTVVGTVELQLRALILEPQEGAGPLEVPDLDFELPLTVSDLPA